MGETLVQLRAAQQHLADWQAHLKAYAEHGRPGQAAEAEKVAGIVMAVLAAAACDTRAVAREALKERH